MNGRGEKVIFFAGMIGFVVVMILSSLGCSFQVALSKTHEGIKAMSAEVEPRLADECLRRARVCKIRGIDQAERCEELVVCRAWKQRYASGVKQTHRGLAECNSVYLAIKAAGIIK